eukprot:1599515-Rhodomonas_salina.1
MRLISELSGGACGGYEYRLCLAPTGLGPGFLPLLKIVSLSRGLHVVGVAVAKSESVQVAVGVGGVGIKQVPRCLTQTQTRISASASIRCRDGLRVGDRAGRSRLRLKEAS